MVSISSLLQVWGGVFYLLNKIFFCIAEHNPERKRIWKIRSWKVYMIGLPAWVFIFICEHNWIAASVEAAGAPSMMLGIKNAKRHDDDNEESRWLKLFARVCVVAGCVVSLWNIGLMTHLTQWLEVGVAAGFLVGTEMLAEKKPVGYLWFIIMNISCGILMGVQGYYWLTLQQVISLGFVIDAYRTEKRNAKK